MLDAVTTTSKALISGFAFYLAETENLLDTETAISAYQESANKKISFINYILDKKLISDKRVAYAVAKYYRMQLFDIEQFKLELIPKEYINNEMVRKHLALPLYKSNNIVYVATVDPTLENLNEFRFLTGSEVRFLVVDAGKLTRLITDIFEKQILTDVTSMVDENAPAQTNAQELSLGEVDSAPVVKFLNSLMRNAIEQRASDIHFEKFKNTYRIRFRIDGILHLTMEPPLNLAQYLIARIKILANLDITEHRVPQDGRFQFAIDNKHSVDSRVSTVPTLHGEKIVIRLLNPFQNIGKIEEIGMDPQQQQYLLNALKYTQGMILVTGPTGSGKTVTLYSSLSHLNSMEKNILTVEDPIEIPLMGVNQVHVNVKTGLTFASALRAFLRQDPDIIMVGEVRDQETADIAVRAAQTGHLVLSTLHTNNAVGAISRLINIGIEPHNLSSSIILVVAQRLARMLCSKCKRKTSIPMDILLREGFKQEELEDLQLYEPVGCENCKNGFRGRTGIFEVVPISEKMEDAIARAKSTRKLALIAEEEGLITLRRSGLNKVKAGVINLDELNRVFY